MLRQAPGFCWQHSESDEPGFQEMERDRTVGAAAGEGSSCVACVEPLFPDTAVIPSALGASSPRLAPFRSSDVHARASGQTHLRFLAGGPCLEVTPCFGWLRRLGRMLGCPAMTCVGYARLQGPRLWTWLSGCSTPTPLAIPAPQPPAAESAQPAVTPESHWQPPEVILSADSPGAAGICIPGLSSRSTPPTGQQWQRHLRLRPDFGPGWQGPAGSPDAKERALRPEYQSLWVAWPPPAPHPVS